MAKPNFLARQTKLVPLTNLDVLICFLQIVDLLEDKDPNKSRPSYIEDKDPNKSRPSVDLKVNPKAKDHSA